MTPVFDWQQPPIAPVSGVLLALAHLEASDAAQPVSIRFEFSEPLPAGAADRLPVALANYCHQQVAVHRAAASDIRHQGWRSLRRGLLALVLALSLATFFRHVHPLPDLFNGLFSEGLVIVGWVVLWHPARAVDLRRRAASAPGPAVQTPRYLSGGIRIRCRVAMNAARLLSALLLLAAGGASVRAALIDSLLENLQRSDFVFGRADNNGPFPPMAWVGAQDHGASDLTLNGLPVRFEERSLSQFLLAPVWIGKKDMILAGEFAGWQRIDFSTPYAAQRDLSTVIPLLAWLRQTGPHRQFALFAAPEYAHGADYAGHEFTEWSGYAGGIVVNWTSDRLAWAYGGVGYFFARAKAALPLRRLPLAAQRTLDRGRHPALAERQLRADARLYVPAGRESGPTRHWPAPATADCTRATLPEPPLQRAPPAGAQFLGFRHGRLGGVWATLPSAPAATARRTTSCAATSCGRCRSRTGRPRRVRRGAGR